MFRIHNSRKEEKISQKWPNKRIANYGGTEGMEPKIPENLNLGMEGSHRGTEGMEPKVPENLKLGMEGNHRGTEGMEPKGVEGNHLGTEGMEPKVMTPIPRTNILTESPAISPLIFLPWIFKSQSHFYLYTLQNQH